MLLCHILFTTPWKSRRCSENVQCCGIWRCWVRDDIIFLSLQWHGKVSLTLNYVFLSPFNRKPLLSKYFSIRNIMLWIINMFAWKINAALNWLPLLEHEILHASPLTAITPHASLTGTHDLWSHKVSLLKCPGEFWRLADPLLIKVFHSSHCQPLGLPKSRALMRYIPYTLESQRWIISLILLGHLSEQRKASPMCY